MGVSSSSPMRNKKTDEQGRYHIDPSVIQRTLHEAVDLFRLIFEGSKDVTFFFCHFRLKIGNFYDIMRMGRKGVRLMPLALRRERKFLFIL